MHVCLQKRYPIFCMHYESERGREKVIGRERGEKKREKVRERENGTKEIEGGREGPREKKTEGENER